LKRGGDCRQDGAPPGAADGGLDARSRRTSEGAGPMRIPMLPMLLVLGLCSATAAATREHSFDDPMFRRCVSWMLDGKGGALIDNICLDEYEIPPPSLFICARKVRTGFLSASDREGCAIVFDEQARKVRCGFIR
jgi:hypothetical protein